MKRHSNSFARHKDDVELASEFGTYNIQPTADTDNAFPAIAQGLPRGLNSAKKRSKEENTARH